MLAISIIALVVSVCALPFTVWAARAAALQARAARDQTQIQREQVDAAREQNQLQRELNHEALQPYVWADIQPDMKQGTLLQLVVGNSGPTVARNVRVVFDPPLSASDHYAETIADVELVLDHGLKSLAPNRTIRWTLGPGFDLLATKDPQLRMVRVEGEGPHGPLPTLEIPIDISQVRESIDAPDGSLHNVRKEIKELTKAVSRIHETMKRIATETEHSAVPTVETSRLGDAVETQEFDNPDSD